MIVIKTCTHLYIYIYIYRERDRQTETDRHSFERPWRNHFLQTFETE